jgi:SAM-dependent methyltransferase
LSAQSQQLDSVWCDLARDVYDTAVYGSHLLRPVLDTEVAIASKIVNCETVLIEVGCGTGQFCRRFIGRVAAVVGVDISLSMIGDLSQLADGRLLLIEGDARRLGNVLAEHHAYRRMSVRRPKVLVTCVMNTLGIMDDITRQQVLAEMASVAGSHGHVFVAVFNGDHFELGIDQFYRVSPRLCGNLDSATIDLDTRELFVWDTGYYSHWSPRMRCGTWPPPQGSGMSS